MHAKLSHSSEILMNVRAMHGTSESDETLNSLSESTYDVGIDEECTFQF